MPASKKSFGILHELMLAGTPDPFPLYDELRELDTGVHEFEPIGAFFVFRYDDVVQMSKDHRTFSSEHFWQSPASMHNADDPEHRRFVDFNSRLMIFKDPPTHTRLRNVVRTAFTPRALQRWRCSVVKATTALLDRITPGEEVDLVTEFAFDVPVAIIAEILGVPTGDRADFHKWSFSFGSTFEFSTQGEARNQAIRDSLKLIDYLSDLADDRRRSPGNDLISLIVNGAEDDGPIELQDLVAQVFFMLSAGNETTANLVTNGISMLIEHPEAGRELTMNPDRIPIALEEMLRYDPPIHLTVRRTSRQTVLGETEIPKGAMVYEVLPAANRDPRRFDHPSRFDIHRTGNRHLSFNQGVHFCVGAPLARLEGEVIFHQLLRRFRRIELGQRAGVRRTTNVGLRGWSSYPVVLHHD